MPEKENTDQDDSWADGVWPDIVCCDGCGRDCHDYICKMCSQDYGPPTSVALRQLAGRWNFDVNSLSEHEIEELSDLVMYATREDCEVRRQEKIYEAFQNFFSDFA